MDARQRVAEIKETPCQERRTGRVFQHPQQTASTK
nr:MAG TPA: hypothetical protein [Bacteriophage sp.]